MRNGKRGRYALEFKQEAVRLVGSGQSIAEVSRSLGVVEQTLSNWVKAKREGKLKEVSGKAGVTAEQMEISRLRAELARVKMERDILGKATAYCVLRKRPPEYRRKLCFVEDEGRPLGIGLQELISNRLKLQWSRAIVVSIEGKGKAMTLSGVDQEDERK